ncbi:MAG: DUF971 domain-containing protein [Gammaproteobacteria bacterium]|nr:DUF971 domain-containing protein [Gammaproteobacteria bacterium]
MNDSAPVPATIKLLKQSRQLNLVYEDQTEFTFSFEFLRVYSPSADVKGHGPGDAVLQVGKQDVDIREIEPVGNYAIKIHFDDGHDTGLYSWNYLYDLGMNMDMYWQDYLQRLKEAGHPHPRHD